MFPVCGDEPKFTPLLSALVFPIIVGDEPSLKIDGASHRVFPVLAGMNRMTAGIGETKLVFPMCRMNHPLYVVTCNGFRCSPCVRG